jgi:hypothetical protein
MSALSLRGPQKSGASCIGFLRERSAWVATRHDLSGASESTMGSKLERSMGESAAAKWDIAVLVNSLSEESGCDKGSLR